MVVFLSSSGLAAVLGGGDAPSNLMNRGDSEERFAVTDAEVATAPVARGATGSRTRSSTRTGTGSCGSG